MTADRNTDHDLPLGGPDTDPEMPVPSPGLAGSRIEAKDRATKPAEVAPAPHRLSQTAKSELSPFHTSPSLASSEANISTTQESESIPQAEVDRHYFLERRILVLEEENTQLSARLRLAEKGVEDARRLAMAASVFALGAMLVAKLLAG